LQLPGGSQPELEHLEQGYISKAHTGLSMLRKSPPRGWNVELIHQLIENLEAEYTVIHRRLQELGDIVRQFSMSGIVEPSQFGNTTNQFNERKNQKVLERRSIIGQIGEGVIADINALWNRKTVPVNRNEFYETVGCHQSRVL
jgi:hypothetical protein